MRSKVKNESPKTVRFGSKGQSCLVCVIAVFLLTSLLFILEVVRWHAGWKRSLRQQTALHTQSDGITLDSNGLRKRSEQQDIDQDPPRLNPIDDHYTKIVRDWLNIKEIDSMISQEFPAFSEEKSPVINTADHSRLFEDLGAQRLQTDLRRKLKVRRIRAEVDPRLYSFIPREFGMTEVEPPRLIRREERNVNDNNDNNQSEVRYFEEELRPDGKNWLSDFDEMNGSFAMMIHTKGFVVDGTIFDSYNYYMMSRMFGRPDCYDGKLLKVVDNPLVLLDGWGANAFQHFLMEVPVRMAWIYHWLKLPRNDNVKLVVPHPTGKIQQWLFQRVLNISQDRLIPTLGWCVRSSFVYMSKSVTMVPFYMHEHPRPRNEQWPRHALTPIQHLITNQHIRRDCVLYLPRNPRGNQRVVWNQGEVIEELQRFSDRKKWRFEIFEPAIKRHLDFDVDRDTLSAAVMIIGTHGGAMANLVMAQRDTYVLEFNDLRKEAGENVRSGYFALAQAAGHHYYSFKPKDWKSYTKARGFHIELDHLKFTLDVMYDRMVKDHPFLILDSKIRD